MDISDLSFAIAPKSDQLNADDLIGGPLTVEIIGVKIGSEEQPVSIDISGGNQPYKPCKSMLRVMVAAWGKDGGKWVGQSLTLFCEPSVRFAGVEVGGIRIKAMTGIEGDQSYMLTVTRSKRKLFRVSELKISASAPVNYPADLFEANIGAWIALIDEGKMTSDDIIAKASARAPLTAEQILKITGAK